MGISVPQTHSCMILLTLGGSAPALWRKMFSPLRPWILFWSCGQAVVAWGHKSPHGATLLLSFFYHACVEILDIYFVMHILRLLLWYFSTAGRSSGLASSEPTENFSLTWCWMTPGMTRSWPHFFFLYRSSKTVVPDSWHDCIRKICFWPAGGSWGRTWCSSAAQLKNCESEVLIRFMHNSFFRSLNLLARAFSEFSGKTWSAKRAQKIRKTGAKNRKRAQFQKVYLWILLWNPFCSESCPFEIFAVKICQWSMFGSLCSILSVCCQISTRNQLIYCSEKPSCMHAMTRTLKDLQKVLAWPNHFFVPWCCWHAWPFLRLVWPVLHSGACHRNVACMSHECCTHAPWMLHAACQVHFAFMRVARMACIMHEQLWLFYMHACMVLSFACMNMGACMLMPKLCSCCFPPCLMCGQKDVLHPLFSKVCRVSRKCHAFGISVRTTTRCLSHYRRLWHRRGWLHGKN